MIDVPATFAKYDEEYLRFDRMDGKPHPRPDMCAFLILDAMLPNPGRDMICAAEHDEFFLDVDMDDFAAEATDELVIDLVRCGVHYDEETESLAMFT